MEVNDKSPKEVLFKLSQPIGLRPTTFHGHFNRLSGKIELQMEPCVLVSLDWASEYLPTGS